MADPQAHALGCELLDMQDRLLVFQKNRKVRRLLQLDLLVRARQQTKLFWLSFALKRVVLGQSEPGETPQQVLREVKCWIRRMKKLANEIGA
ncbi:hypothetical protein [Hymenobacter sp. YC55]|uniref:hypothetical protein n=1 Tax=Hymenobacter sp. YC55 TaxID=3034019 RepID=UPI0023F89EB3|nr:hypothetical protein [Hymenobacter sp. YC55]MDF7812860.1 hypothetical protein [Hymenobacter sp. YC55]